MPDPMVAYYRGDFRPLSEATVSIRAKALNYGLGCFEGIRAYWREDIRQLFIFRPQDHFLRFLQSSKIIQVPVTKTVEELTEITRELLRRNGHREDVYIRPLAFNNSEMLSPMFTKDDNELAFYTLPLRDYLDPNKGVSVCVSSWRRISDNMIPARAKPTAAYLNSALARHEAKSNGFDEAVFLTQDGYVSEGSAEHIFLVRNGTLVTPTSQEDNLDGITRRTLCDIVPAELGLAVQERRVSRTELYIAEEAFFCGTGAEVIPVTAVDRRPLGDGKPGPITRRIMDLYHRVVRAEIEKYRRWCVPVY